MHAPREPGAAAPCSSTPAQAEARELARATIDAFDDVDASWPTPPAAAPRCTNTATCSSGRRARRALAAKVRDVPSCWPRESRAPSAIRAVKVAYHDACHLAHAQQVRDQPRALLRGIPGLELLEPADWELCCGSAGIYNVIQPEPAAELGAPQGREPAATGAEAIAAANPGCGSSRRPLHGSIPDPPPHALLTTRSEGADREPRHRPGTDDRLAEILTDAALAFVGELHGRFGARRKSCSQARAASAARRPTSCRDARDPRGRLAGRRRRAPTTPTAASRSPARPTASSSSTRSTPAPRASWPTSRTPTRRPGTTRSRATST